jgi:hypothetical protein
MIATKTATGTATDLQLALQQACNFIATSLQLKLQIDATLVAN